VEPQIPSKIDLRRSDAPFSLLFIEPVRNSQARNLIEILAIRRQQQGTARERRRRDL
jgi:hypothetical protein